MTYFIKTILIVALITSTLISDSKHGKNIHQFIAVNAFMLLQNKYIEAGGDENDLKLLWNGIFNQQGEAYVGVRDESTKILFGAWEEDETDSVYDYRLTAGFKVPSLTHFWDSDKGENHTYKFKAIGKEFNNIPNAWSKARSMLFSYDFSPNNGHHWIMDGKTNRTGPLIDFYLNGTYVQVPSMTSNICNVHKHMADEWLFTKVPDAR